MKKNTGLIIGIILGIVLIGVILVLVLGNTNANKGISNSIIDQNTNIVSKEDSQDKSIQSIVKDAMSSDFTGDIKNTLPTINDFETGFEISLDKDKNIDNWKIEDKNKALERGYQQGYYRDFEKGSASLFDIDNYEAVQFNLSVYSKDKILDVLQEDILLVEKGEKISVDDDNEEIKYLYNLLKDPKIGDKSIMWSSQMEELSLKKYNLSFVKKNVYVNITCFSGDTQKAVDSCIDWAKFVERNI